MDTRQLGNTDLHVTCLAYGCMPLGGWGPEDISDESREKADAALDQAISSGYNFFDHADIYCGGKSEKIFGEWLSKRKDLRESMVIQSKCGIRPGTEHNPQQYNFSYEHIMRSAEQSIKNLQCDYLDILTLHRPDALAEASEVARAFRDLKQQGLVNHFGVSNHSPGKIDLLQSQLDDALVVNQIQLSILHSQLISSGVDWNINDRGFNHDACLEYCQLHNICIQAWSPLAHGFLDDRPVADEHPDQEIIKSVQEEIQIIAHQNNCSPSAISLAWLLRIPGFVQPIIGSTKPERIKAAADAASIQLSRDDWYRLFLAGRGQRLP